MASVAMRIKTYLLFMLIAHFNAETTHLPVINPQLVNISDQWQINGIVHQEKFIHEVVVKQALDHLYLVCAIEPALPTTEEHFKTRNDLVKFKKLYPENYVLVDGIRYWSDDQKMTAISLNTKTIGLFGIYGCSYGHIEKTVEVLAENNGVLQYFPGPKTLEEMFSFSFVKKLNKSYFENEMQPVAKSKKFHCNDINSETKATSVHKLKPSDIGVVATLGDSITVGLGARGSSLHNFFTEYRGLSWSNGGDLSVDEIVTLPNILKRFNSNLRGYSNGNYRHFDKKSGLNMGTVSSSTSSLVDQVNDLIYKIQVDKKINFQGDWKVVTIMTGSRDLCRLCYDKVISPYEYIQILMKTLNTLQAKLPRTFVNLILPLNVTSLDIFFNNIDCSIHNWSICPCLQNKSMKEKISNFFQGYKRLVYELIESGLYDGKDDFAVVIQPMFEKWLFTQQDRDLFSLDCLHFSIKGNSLAATLLWNNMVEPVRKKTSKKSNNSIKCLQKDFPYFFTNKNSESTWEEHSKFHNGMSDGVIALLSLSISFTFVLIAAFIFVKYKLRTPVKKLRFHNRPWFKYYI